MRLDGGGTDQGTQLKIGGSSGFKIPMSGNRDIGGTTGNLLSLSVLWTSTESGTGAWFRYIHGSNANINRDFYTNGKQYGYSVRCVRN